MKHFIKTLIFLSLLISTNLLAKPKIEVYENEYVFTTSTQRDSNLSTSKSTQEFTKQFNIIERTKGGLILASPKNANTTRNLSSQSEIVNYDKAKDQCIQNPVAGFNCEPNYVYRTTISPDDTFYNNNQLWGLNGNFGIDAPGAWNYAQGNDVVIGVIDTGINLGHADLNPNIWTNRGDIDGNGVDDDGNGYVDDTFGVNVINGQRPNDDNGHGTHVAGTICARGDNGLGVTGVNWRCNLIGVKFLSTGGGGSLLDGIKALDYLTDLKVNKKVPIVVVNLSWGSGANSATLRAALERGRNQGIIYVAAAGNSRSNNDTFPFYPASYDLDNIVSVASIDESGDFSSFSNFGVNSVDIAAPGGGIYSTYIPTNQSFTPLSGTSMAAPHVTGAIALLYSHQVLPYRDLINRTLNHTRPWSELNGKVKTAGLLNVFLMFRPDINPTPPAVCRQNKFKKCRKKCKQNFKGKPKRKTRCINDCRVKFDCPEQWHSFITELFF